MHRNKSLKSCENLEGKETVPSDRPITGKPMNAMAEEVPVSVVTSPEKVGGAAPAMDIEQKKMKENVVSNHYVEVIDAVARAVYFNEEVSADEESSDKEQEFALVPNPHDALSPREGAQGHISTEDFTPQQSIALLATHKPMKKKKSHTLKSKQLLLPKELNFANNTEKRSTKVVKKHVGKVYADDGVKVKKVSGTKKAKKAALQQPAGLLASQPNCQPEDPRVNLLRLQHLRSETGTWVECIACKKWRFLADINNPQDVHPKWECSMNTDADFASCSVQEVGPSAEEEEDMVHGPYSAGSLVWARLPGFPWWPAMVDDDPDFEQYYWLNDYSDIPTYYNVVFFDSDPVSRSWLTPNAILPFTGRDDSLCKISDYTKDFRKRLTVALKDAQRAYTMTITQRLQEFSFVSRYQGKLGRKGKKRRRTQEVRLEESTSSASSSLCSQESYELRKAQMQSLSQVHSASNSEKKASAKRKLVFSDSSSDDSGDDDSDVSLSPSSSSQQLSTVSTSASVYQSKSSFKNKENVDKPIIPNPQQNKNISKNKEKLEKTENKSSQGKCKSVMENTKPEIISKVLKKRSPLCVTNSSNVMTSKKQNIAKLTAADVTKMKENSIAKPSSKVKKSQSSTLKEGAKVPKVPVFNIKNFIKNVAGDASKKTEAPVKKPKVSKFVAPIRAPQSTSSIEVTVKTKKIVTTKEEKSMGSDTSNESPPSSSSKAVENSKTGMKRKVPQFNVPKIKKQATGAASRGQGSPLVSNVQEMMSRVAQAAVLQAQNSTTGGTPPRASSSRSELDLDIVELPAVTPQREPPRTADCTANIASVFPGAEVDDSLSQENLQSFRSSSPLFDMEE